MVACETSRAKSDLLDRQVASLEKAYHSTSLLMLHGTTTYLEVLTAQQSLLSAQLQQTANRFKEIQCVINLYSALGGGKN
jgi:outer membrane protein TolC